MFYVFFPCGAKSTLRGAGSRSSISATERVSACYWWKERGKEVRRLTHSPPPLMGLQLGSVLWFLTGDSNGTCVLSHSECLSTPFFFKIKVFTQWVTTLGCRFPSGLPLTKFLVLRSFIRLFPPHCSHVKVFFFSITEYLYSSKGCHILTKSERSVCVSECGSGGSTH